MRISGQASPHSKLPWLEITASLTRFWKTGIRPPPWPRSLRFSFINEYTLRVLIPTIKLLALSLLEGTTMFTTTTSYPSHSPAQAGPTSDNGMNLDGSLPEETYKKNDLIRGMFVAVPVGLAMWAGLLKLAVVIVHLL